MSRARILADYVSSGDELADKAPLASPAFTGTPTGITKTHVGLSNVDNNSTSTIQSGTTAANVGLGNVTNESKATMLASPTLTGTTTVSGDIVPSTPLSHRNMITNGGMQIWQRGTAMGSGTSTYRQDMFKIERRGSTVPIVIRSTDVPAGEGFGYSARMYAIAEPDDGFHFYTGVELPGTGQYGVFETGTKMILSFWIKSAYSTRTIDPVLYLKNGLEGVDYSQGLDSTEDSTAIPTSWTRMEFNYTMPSWSAGAGSLTNVTCAAIRFLMGNDDTPIDIYITGVQLELGSNPTPFEHRTYADDLAKCQRYFYNIFHGTSSTLNFDSHHYSASGNAGWNVFTVPFPVPMRTMAVMSHSMTSAKCTGTSVVGGSDTWTYYIQNQGYSGVHGNGNASNFGGSGIDKANIGTYYVSPSTNTSSHILIGSGTTFNFSAEL